MFVSFEVHALHCCPPLWLSPHRSPHVPLAWVLPFTCAFVVWSLDAFFRGCRSSSRGTALLHLHLHHQGSGWRSWGLCSWLPEDPSTGLCRAGRECLAGAFIFISSLPLILVLSSWACLPFEFYICCLYFFYSFSHWSYWLTFCVSLQEFLVCS